jgi:hypothetical protein
MTAPHSAVRLRNSTWIAFKPDQVLKGKKNHDEALEVGADMDVGGFDLALMLKALYFGNWS